MTDTRAQGIPLLTRLLAVPGTTRIRGIDSEVALGPEDGMPQECVLSLDNVRAIRKNWLETRICSLSAQKLDEVCEALRYAAGCS
ncbi:MAG: type II toxin-antitoxin system PemK/MazF family toxin [Gaiellaceae bacterium]